MGLGLADRSGPLETKVAASGFYRQARDRRAVDPRTVQIELLVTEAVRPALSDRNELRPEDVPVERIRAAPVRDGDHGMIELDRRHCRLSLEQVTTSLTLDSRQGGWFRGRRMSPACSVTSRTPGLPGVTRWPSGRSPDTKRRWTSASSGAPTSTSPPPPSNPR